MNAIIVNKCIFQPRRNIQDDSLTPYSQVSIEVQIKINEYEKFTTLLPLY